MKIPSARTRALWIAITLVSASPVLAQPVRLALPAFGSRAEIEIRDMNRNAATEAAKVALRELHAVDALLDAGDAAENPLVMLNGQAGQGPQTVDSRLFALLERSLSFCLWSNGAFGPTAGALHGLRAAQPSDTAIDLDALRQSLMTAQCAALRIARPLEEGGEGPITVELAARARLDLRAWALGFAIDQAMDQLKSHGVTNAWIECGSVRRAIGPGPEGEGWLAILSFPGVAQPVDRVWLRDQALAVSLPLRDQREGGWPYIDHRNGRSAAGVVAVATVSELAVDAQALAFALPVLGLREGKMRLASLKPVPSAIFFLGEGRGEPLRSDFRWADLARKRRYE